MKVQKKGNECEPIFQFLTRFPTKASPNRQLMIHSKMVNNCCRHLQLKTDQIFNFSNLYTLVIADKPLILNQLGKTTKVLFNLQKKWWIFNFKVKKLSQIDCVQILSFICQKQTLVLRFQ